MPACLPDRLPASHLATCWHPHRHLTSPAPRPACSCGAAITKLERIPAEAGLFISPLTLQGFKTEADLAAHVQKVWPRLQAAVGGGNGAGMPMAPGGMQAAAGRSMQGMAYYGQQQQQAGGWKPPPPPGAPGYASQGGSQPRSTTQNPRHGYGSVMRPR